MGSVDMEREAEDNPRAVLEDSDDEGAAEVVDYRFLAAVQKKDCALPARGEKDFEPDGTNKQERILQFSRDAMYAALSVERDLSAKNYIRATWDARRCMGRLNSADSRGTMFKSIGQTDNNGITWLLPEELLFMIDRGNIECFYEHVDVAMSLQAAYAEMIPHIGIDEFQVYAYLKRAGFLVQRYRQSVVKKAEQKSHFSILSMCLTAAIERLCRTIAGMTCSRGLLSNKQTYYSYESIYARLSLVPCHRHNSPSNTITARPKSPLKITFNVWKPSTHFRKSAPGPADFVMAILDSRQHNLCSLQDFEALFSSLPEDETYSSMSQFTRLKIGKRHFVMAVADMGIISFLSFGDVSFGSEHVYTPWQPWKPRRIQSDEQTKY